MSVDDFVDKEKGVVNTERLPMLLKEWTKEVSRKVWEWIESNAEAVEEQGMQHQLAMACLLKLCTPRRRPLGTDH